MKPVKNIIDAILLIADSIKEVSKKLNSESKENNINLTIKENLFDANSELSENTALFDIIKENEAKSFIEEKIKECAHYYDSGVIPDSYDPKYLGSSFASKLNNDWTLCIEAISLYNSYYVEDEVTTRVLLFKSFVDEEDDEEIITKVYSFINKNNQNNQNSQVDNWNFNDIKLHKQAILNGNYTFEKFIGKTSMLYN